MDDITEAYIKCEDHVDAIENPPSPPPTREKGKGKSKSKSRLKNVVAENHAFKQGAVEHHGVMFMYKKELERSREWFKQINGRLAQISFKTKGPDLIITNVLAPHTWANGEKSREIAYEIGQSSLNCSQKHCWYKNNAIITWW